MFHRISATPAFEVNAAGETIKTYIISKTKEPEWTLMTEVMTGSGDGRLWIKFFEDDDAAKIIITLGYDGRIESTAASLDSAYADANFLLEKMYGPDWESTGEAQMLSDLYHEIVDAPGIPS